MSYDHVPPKAAGNRYPVVRAAFEQAISLEPVETSGKRDIQQQGAGEYSMCRPCNTNMGLWYVPAYAKWCKQVMIFLMKSGGAPSLYYPYEIHPLRVIKQVASMFFSINNPRLREAQPELAEFVLNREKRYLSPEYGFYVYLTTSPRMRYLGLMAQVWVGRPEARGKRSQITVLTEMSHPPFGFVLTFEGSPPPDDRLYNISHFARYGYDDVDQIFLRLNTLPVVLAFPGDYRTPEEIVEQRLKSELRSLGLVPAGVGG